MTDGHPGMVDHTNAKSHMIGSVLSEGRQDGVNVTADIIVYDQTPITAGKRELSVGYRVTLDETPGVSPEGEEYDVAVTGIFPNHLGIVAKGRAGTARLNLDSADAVSVSTEDDCNMTTVKVRLDSGLEYDAAPEVAVAMATSAAALKLQKDRADAAEAARDGMQAQVDAHPAALAQARADSLAQVQARAKLDADATALGVTVPAGADDKTLRATVIKSVRGDSLDLAGKSDAYLEAAYDLAVVDGKKAKANAGANRAAASGARADSAGTAAPTMSARDKMIADLKKQGA